MWRDVVLWLALVVILLVLGNNFVSRNVSISRSKTLLADTIIQGQEDFTEPLNEKGITVSEILREPLVYEGLLVTVDGRIKNWLTKRAFTVGGSNEILVIAPSDLPSPYATNEENLALGDNVLTEVVGIVRILSEEEIENILGVSFESDFLNRYDFDNEPIILAQKVVELN